MTCLCYPRSEPEGMPRIGTINAIRDGKHIKTWVWIREEWLPDGPGTPVGDASPSTVGKATE